MKRRTFLSTSTAIAATTLASTVIGKQGQDATNEWPHWRGPNRNDIVSQSSGFVDGRWPLEKAWQRQIGIGSTSPLVVGDRYYTLGYHDGNDSVYCLNAATGETIWYKKYAAPRFGRNAVGDQGLYAGPTSTPEYDATTNTLYTLSTDGELIAWKAADGEQRWAVNLYDRYQMARRPKIGRSGRRDYGYTTAPLLHGDQLLIEAGGNQGTIVALDKHSGDHVWGSEDREFAGHTGGIVPLGIEGVACAAVLTFAKLLIVRLDSGHVGKTVAEYPFKTEWANNIASPGVQGNSLIISAGYNHERTVRLDVTLDGVKEVWRSDRFSNICTPVIAHDRVYLCSKKTMCLDFVTGKLMWEGGKTGDAGSIVLTSDNRLVVLAGNGDLFLCDSAMQSPAKLNEVARQGRLFRRDAWPHVVLAGGRIYCKGKDGELVCFGITR